MDGIVTVSEFNNLKQDLHSIQDTIVQIFGKIGNLETKSWKLRDESGDLPIQVLSNKCQYFSSDLHSTRASHIMLLELIVDRLALMLQSYAYFTDRLVGKPSSRVMEKAPNLGPLCKKYWKKAKLLRQFVTSLQAEVQKKSEDLVSLGLTLEAAHEENTLLRDMMVKHGLGPGAETPRSGKGSRASRAGDGGGVMAVPPRTAGSMQWSEFGQPIKEEEEMADSAVDVAPSSTSLLSQVKLPTQITVNNMKTVSKWLMNVGSSVDAKTQTVETAFVECNVCSSIQDLLEAVGGKITMTWNMLHAQSKPTKRLIMSPPKEAMKWCEIHSLLLTEVDGTVRGVVRKNEEVQARSQDQQCRITTLEAEATTLRLELDALRQQHTSGLCDSNKREEQLKQQISKQAMEYHHNLEIRRVEEGRMRERITDLEGKLSEFQNKYFTEATARRDAVEELGRVRKEAERARLMRDTCNKLSSQIGDLEEQLNGATDEMNRYQCRNDQLIKQNKMLTLKQEQLLTQLEAFDLECETMREQLEAARDNSNSTTHELSDVVKQKQMLHSENTRLQEAISQIQTDIANLNNSLSKKDSQLNQAQRVIEEEREKETTLISYPLLVGGERIPRELNRLVQANNIRILRLEEQNRLLRDTTLQRELEESQPPVRQPPTREKSGGEPNPQQLWNSKCFKELVKSQHVFERVFTPIDYYDGIKSLVEGHGKVRPESCPSAQVPMTPDRVVPPYNSPLPTNPSSPAPTTPTKVHYSCEGCGKMFGKASDLEIHLIYCQ